MSHYLQANNPVSLLLGNRLASVAGRWVRTALFAVACLGSLGNCSSADTPEELATQLTARLQSQAAAWNRGDIDQYMQTYWKSEKLTFSSGGKTQRGWKATRDGYKKRYATPELMGKLTFSQLEIQPLGQNAAMMLGRWQLKRDEPISGNFSLIWRQFDSQWVIIHDHTSLQPSASDPG